MRNPIRTGDSFSRTYTFYNPLSTNNKLPDYASPINLTGQSVVFIIKNGTVTKRYDTGQVALTPLLGKVVVTLTAAETALLTPGLPTTTCLEMTKAGVITTTTQRAEAVKKQTEV